MKQNVCQLLAALWMTFDQFAVQWMFNVGARGDRLLIASLAAALLLFSFYLALPLQTVNCSDCALIVYVNVSYGN